MEFLEYVKTNKNYKPIWRIRCFCGKEFTTIGAMILNGDKQSCGCKKPQRDYSKGEESKSYKHGDSFSRLYGIWVDMRARCHNSNLKNYKNYGGRGIKVCKEWDESYTAFKEWALKNNYKDDLTIDRIDVNGNYEPDNCRWTTMLVQSRNKRANTKNLSKTSGVTLIKGTTWVVRIKSRGVQYNIGSFKMSELKEAIEARRDAEIKYWGEEHQDFDEIFTALEEEGRV